jgi:hypothetical protein
MAEELGYDDAWIDNQVDEYTEVAEGYLVPDTVTA